MTYVIYVFMSGYLGEKMWGDKGKSRRPIRGDHKSPRKDEGGLLKHLPMLTENIINKDYDVSSLKISPATNLCRMY